MLHYLRIQNIAIIDELRVEFRAGFNVLTGETGVGKSILIGALTLALGGRADSDSLRTGADRAQVEAVFELPARSAALEQALLQGIEAEEGELILRRTLARGGRSRSFVNGTPVTLTQLAGLTPHLVDIHGQHEHQVLLHRETHLDFLDAFGGAGPLRDAYRAAYDSWESLREERRRLETAERERLQRQDLLAFQMKEIEKAALQPGEPEELVREKELLAHAEKLLELSSGAYDLLYAGEGAAAARLHEALRLLEAALRLHPGLGVTRETLAGLLYQIQDAAEEVRTYRDRISADPGRLDRVQERLELIQSLTRKYGATIEEVLLHRDAASKELEALRHTAERAGVLQEETRKVQENLVRLAVGLSIKRSEARRRLEQELGRHLASLGMGKGAVQVEMALLEDPDGWAEVDGVRLQPGRNGIDRVEFLFAPNPGEAPKPLNRIASGGELARVMLALKSALAEADQIPTLLFDEVDVGISGRAADALGDKLRRLSRARQVFCVTHLPQVAGRAEHHYKVEKVVEKGRATTRVTELAFEERVAEIARMSGGRAVSETTLRHARELLGRSG